MILYYSVLCLLQIAIYWPYALSRENALQPSCKSPIYCESDLLHDVQLTKLYKDSKTFVDKKLLRNEFEILSMYKALKNSYNGEAVPEDRLRQFVDANFEDGDELEEWIPPDFTPNPSLMSRVRDKYYRQWVHSLNKIWPKLARKIKDDVRTDPDKYSLIWVPNGFFIPGGRFRELYYWDTYWIVNGLILCDMVDTARGVIHNIVFLVDKFGFMPNGARKYYENRSQTPMLIQMVERYYEETGDFAYVRSVIYTLENEFNFWMENRTVTFEKNGELHKMAIYNVKSRGPRPESYREDYEAAKKFDTEEEKTNFYCNVKSAAETGWDFSSRWFVTTNGTNRGGLHDTQTPSIVPVDLNSILHANAVVMSNWFQRMGDVIRFNAYKTIARQLLNSIQNVMWVEKKGCWFDWDLINHKHRDYFYVSNIVPLWTKSYLMPKETIDSVLGYLKNEHIIDADYTVQYKGTPTSLFVSKQQWDFPNAWPPMQAFIIEGLERTKDENAQSVARNLAEVWLHTNYKGFTENNLMYEKYDVLADGKTGELGEYEPQSGFGWTNGIVLELLNRWGDTVSYNDYASNSNEPTTET